MLDDEKKDKLSKGFDKIILMTLHLNGMGGTDRTIIGDGLANIFEIVEYLANMLDVPIDLEMVENFIMQSLKEEIIIMED